MEPKGNPNEREKLNGHEKILSINFNQDQGNFQPFFF